jgi:hypothetical protein
VARAAVGGAAQRNGARAVTRHGAMVLAGGRCGVVRWRGRRTSPPGQTKTAAQLDDNPGGSVRRKKATLVG